MFFILHGNVVFPVETGLDAYVDERLGKECQFIQKRRECRFMASQSCQNLEGGNDTVSGGMFVQANQMTRTFPSQEPSLFLQGFQNVAVADIGANEIDFPFLQGDFNSHIGHECPDDTLRSGIKAGRRYRPALPRQP